MQCFYKSMKKNFSKNFCVKLSSQLVKAIINCSSLTGLACTRIYKSLVFSHRPCKLRLCERPRACKSTGTVQLSHLASRQLLLNNKFYALIYSKIFKLQF